MSRRLVEWKIVDNYIILHWSDGVQGRIPWGEPQKVLAFVKAMRVQIEPDKNVSYHLDKVVEMSNANDLPKP